MEPEPTPRSWATSPALIPALTALGAISLYVIGVLNLVGSLRDAELSTEEVLPLLPIERHLSAGIGAVTNVATLVTLATFGLLIVAMYIEHDRPAKQDQEPSPTPDPPDPPRHFLRRHPSLIYVGVLALAMVLVSPLAALSNLPGWGLGLVAMLALAMRGASGTAMAVGYIVVAFSVQGVLEPFVRPDPLPSADLRMEDDSRRTGEWIGSNDDRVYIAQSGKVVAYNSSEVSWTRITHREPDPDESLPQLLGLADRD